MAVFSELQGISTEVNVVEYEGSRELMLRNQPSGAVIRSKAASTNGGDLESWWKQSASGKQTKRPVDVAARGGGPSTERWGQHKTAHAFSGAAMATRCWSH